MKLLIYGLYFAFLSVLTTMFIYPFCHETGHYLAARFVGYEVMEVDFIVNSSVTLWIDDSVMGLSWSSFGGLLFPLVVVLALPSRCFCFLAVKIMLLITDTLAAIYSLGCLWCYLLRLREFRDDMVIVAEVYPHTVYINLLLLMMLIILLVVYMKKKRLFRRVYRCLEEKIYGIESKNKESERVNGL